MIEHTYTEPVSKLLKLGRPDNRGWHDYLKMGITRADIPELIRLVEDKELRWMKKPDDLPEDSDITEWYGQIYAWRALAQLKAEEAIPALLSILQEIDVYMDDWYGEESFKVFPMIGLQRSVRWQSISPIQNMEPGRVSLPANPCKRWWKHILKQKRNVPQPSSLR